MNSTLSPLSQEGYSPLIHLENVNKYFKVASGEVHVLKNINLSIGQGEFLSIVGRSGSGKSTLINMLAGIDHPTSGAIRIGGLSLNFLNEGQLSIWRGKSVGIVFQFFQLLPMLSLLENILLPMDFAGIIPPGDRETRAMALLNQVGLDSLAGNLPSDLSGGQLQHAAIARALANDPPIIMADEPTGNLDTKNARAVFDLFESLAETGKTILMVTHDDSLANMAGRKLIISDGELLDEQITRFFSFLSHAQLLNLSHAARTVTLGPQDILPIIDMPVLLWSIEGEGVIRLTRTNDADSSLIKIDSGQIFGVDDHSSGGIIACSLQSGSGIRVILASGPDFRRCVDHAPVLSGYIKGIPSSSVPDFYQETGDFGQVKP